MATAGADIALKTAAAAAIAAAVARQPTAAALLAAVAEAEPCAAGAQYAAATAARSTATGQFVPAERVPVHPVQQPEPIAHPVQARPVQVRPVAAVEAERGPAVVVDGPADMTAATLKRSSPGPGNLPIAEFGSQMCKSGGANQLRRFAFLKLGYYHPAQELTGERDPLPESFNGWPSNSPIFFNNS